MIKPASYWALHKTCDPLTLGRVGATLGGQSVDPPLNPAELALVSVIQQDSEWMDERIDAYQQREKERKAAYRKRMSRNVPECPRDKTGHDGTTRDKTGRTEKDACPAPIPPSVPPSCTLDLDKSKSASTCNTRVRGDVPELKEVVSAATSVMGIPEWYARWWYEQMVAYDWTSTKGAPIGHGNWRAMLKAWHNRSLGDPKEYERVRGEYEAKKPKVVKVTAADWCLCVERCAKFRDGSCAAGKVVPPQLRPHMIPPEECDGFARIG